MYKKKHVAIVLIIITLAVTLFISSQNRIIDAQTDNTYQKFQVLFDIVQKIRDSYVEEVNTNKLIDKAINEILEELDPHSVYVPPERFTRMTDNFAGYGGIGISFVVVRDKITVMSVMEGGPSDKVGIEPGDKIVGISGESAVGIKQDDVPKLLKGPPGTKVTVTVERAGEEKPLDFTITRNHVDVPSLTTSYIVDNDIGYIRLERFSSTTGNELERTLRELEKKGMKKILLDLRGNTGGYLHEAVAVADKFLPGNKKIVYTKGRIRGANREEYSTNRSTYDKYPLIIMINRGSASASEIVSGAIQDWDRGLIVGETSFGKGLVQTQMRLSNGGALLLTTAKYYTPSGRLIQRPYKDKTREEYREEAANDSLRQVAILKEERPVFNTSGGRTVYGGGGITPDISIPSGNDTIPGYLAGIYYSREMPVQTFADKYAALNKNRWENVENFIRDFRLTDEILNQFKETMDEINYDYDEEKLASSREDLEFVLKIEIAFQLWYDYGRQKVLNSKDSQFDKALQLFDKAEELMRNYGYK